MSIKRISSSRLPNEYHLGYMSQTWDIVKDLAVGVDAFTAAKTEFHTAIDGEDAAYKKSLKISTTEDMLRADTLRDAFMKAARGILGGYAELPDTDPRQRKAKVALQVFKDYGFSVSDSYTKQTVKMDNMWQVLQQMEGDLELLGVKDILEQAMQQSAVVKNYFAARINEQAERIVGELKTARQRTDQACQQLCNIIDALLLIQPSEALTTAAKRIGTLTDYYKQYYIKSSSSSSSSSSSAGSATSQPADPGAASGTTTDQGGDSSQGGSSLPDDLGTDVPTGGSPSGSSGSGDQGGSSLPDDLGQG